MASRNRSQQPANTGPLPARGSSCIWWVEVNTRTMLYALMSRYTKYTGPRPFVTYLVYIGATLRVCIYLQNDIYLGTSIGPHSSPLSGSAHIHAGLVPARASAAVAGGCTTVRVWGSCSRAVVCTSKGTVLYACRRVCMYSDIHTYSTACGVACAATLQRGPSGALHIRCKQIL